MAACRERPPLAQMHNTSPAAGSNTVPGQHRGDVTSERAQRDVHAARHHAVRNFVRLAHIDHPCALLQALLRGLAVDVERMLAAGANAEHGLLRKNWISLY